MSDRIEKGDLAEYAVINFLLHKRYKLAKPIGADWKYDLILVRNDKFERIQTKWCVSDENKICVSGRSTSYSSITKYTQKDIDWLAAYDERNDKCFFIPSTLLGMVGRSVIQLRYSKPTTTNQYSDKILYAKDFENI